MNFNYFDIHSHLNLKPLYENVEEIVAGMKEKGIGTITVGTDLETSRIAVELAEKYDNLWATVGLHPNECNHSFVLSHSEGQADSSVGFDYEEYLKLAKHPRVVAIGECGLDYYRLKIVDSSFNEIKEQQKELFKKHIEIALEVGKPLMIHARPSKGSMDAYFDVLDILEEENFLGKVNFHFFVGDIAIAKRIEEKGWTMSFDGPITFSRDYDEVIRYLPIKSIMAETDAPFAAPASYRGQISMPYMVEEIYRSIAEIKEIDPEEVRIQILKNVEDIFGIS